MTGAVTLLVLLLLAAPAIGAQQHEYVIRAAVRRWWPEPYRSHSDMYVSQCWVESRLKADAVSPAGAIGLCQIMPDTAANVLGQGRLRGKARGEMRAALRDAKTNAEIGARYMAKMFRFWFFQRSYICRWTMSIGSYNAGPGNIREAQDYSGGKLCWPEVSPHLYKVTGARHSNETLTYVQRVQIKYLLLQAGK